MKHPKWKLTKVSEKERPKVIFTEKEILFEAFRSASIFTAIANQSIESFKSSQDKKDSKYLQQALGIQLIQVYSMLGQQTIAWLLTIKEWIEASKNGKRLSVLEKIFNQITITPKIIEQLEVNFKNNKENFLSLLSINTSLEETDRYLGDVLTRLFGMFHLGEDSDYYPFKLQHIYNNTKHGCVVLLSKEHNKLIVPDLIKFTADKNGTTEVTPFFLPNKIIEVENIYWQIELITIQFRRILYFHLKDRFKKEEIPDWIKNEVRQSNDQEVSLMKWAESKQITATT